jgi:serine/threonine-protein kinase
MSEVSPRGEGPLPLSLGLRIEPACNRFELAWQAGQRPRIEDFLGELPEPERSALARELIALEIDYRRRAGEDPPPDEYRARFPDLYVPPTVAGPAGPGAAGPAPGLPAVPGYEIL